MMKLTKLITPALVGVSGFLDDAAPEGVMQMGHPESVLELGLGCSKKKKTKATKAASPLVPETGASSTPVAEGDDAAPTAAAVAKAKANWEDLKASKASQEKIDAAEAEYQKLLAAQVKPVEGTNEDEKAAAEKAEAEKAEAEKAEAEKAEAEKAEAEKVAAEKATAEANAAAALAADKAKLTKGVIKKCPTGTKLCHMRLAITAVKYPTKVQGFKAEGEALQKDPSTEILRFKTNNAEVKAKMDDHEAFYAFLEEKVKGLNKVVYSLNDTTVSWDAVGPPPTAGAVQEFDLKEPANWPDSFDQFSKDVYKYVLGADFTSANSGEFVRLKTTNGTAINIPKEHVESGKYGQAMGTKFKGVLAHEFNNDPTENDRKKDDGVLVGKNTKSAKIAQAQRFIKAFKLAAENIPNDVTFFGKDSSVELEIADDENFEPVASPSDRTTV